MGKKILPVLFGIIGAGFSGLAFFALQLGVGHSSHWGPGRKIVAGVGLAFILIAVLTIVWPFFLRGLKRVNQFFQHLLEAIFGWPPVDLFLQAFQSRLAGAQAAFGRLRAVRWYHTQIRPGIARFLNSRFIRLFTGSQERLAAVVTFFVAIGIVAIYVWFVSVGRWTNWPKTTTYYFQLADAFLHGQTSLLVKPDPALLKLADPYDFNSRQNIQTPWDVSYFNGKFYLYWGSAPAVLLAALHPLYPREIRDQVLVFAFLSAAFLFACLLILRMRARLFPGLSWAYVLPGIILAGLANPLPWLLNRPAVYEAAIASGQFFLISGLYFGFRSVEGSRISVWKLALASLCWIFAVGSRTSMAPAAAFLLLVTAWRAYTLEQHNNKKALSLIALGFPFAAGLGAISWYNQVRFGSWFEFGHRYQLTGMNLHAIYDQVISIANIPVNLHNYLINPFRTLTIFPYVKPNWGGHFIFFPIYTPKNYYSEQISGLILVVPYVILAAIPVLFLIGRGWELLRAAANKSAGLPIKSKDSFMEWTAFTLSGASLLAFGPILLFIVATMRYLADAVPLIVLTSTLGFWQGTQFLKKKPASKRWFLLLVIVLTAMSAVISCLLAVTSYDARFEKLNPILFDHLTRMLQF